MRLDRIRSAMPSPAMAVALAALFVALGGTAWAVATVGPQDIQDDAVRARHIALGHVFSGHVADDSLRSADLQNGQVASLDIRNGGVRSADHRQGSITAREIAENAVGGAAIVPDSVTGQQVAEKTLGEVPSAATAENVLAGRFADGELTNLRGVRGVSQPLGDGTFDVAFFRSVSACVPAVTLASVGGVAPLAFQPEGSPDTVLRVLTRDNEGMPADRAFSIVVVC